MINTPYLLNKPISYFLIQIDHMYEEGIPYSFKFDGLIKEDIIAICLWGSLPIYDGAIANFTQKVEIENIASYINFGGLNRIFDFFSNLQCLITVDEETIKKLSFFQKGKYGFVFKGKKDYFLLMHYKSLDLFQYIDKINEYCQFWLLKIDDYKILNILNLKSSNKQILPLTDTIKDLKKQIEENYSNYQKEMKEYVEQIKKIKKDHNKELQNIENNYIKEKEEKEALIKAIKNKRKRKFVGLQEYKESFSLIGNDYYIRLDDTSESQEKNSFDEYICVICDKYRRNVLFKNCGHCCVCEKCLVYCDKKFDKQKQVNKYLCPLCNNVNNKSNKIIYSEIMIISFE